MERAPERVRKIFYLCDRQACPDCDPFGYCMHTTNLAHARHRADDKPHNLELGPDGNYWEKEEDT